MISEQRQTFNQLLFGQKSRKAFPTERQTRANTHTPKEIVQFRNWRRIVAKRKMENSKEIRKKNLCSLARSLRRFNMSQESSLTSLRLPASLYETFMSSPNSPCICCVLGDVRMCVREGKKIFFSQFKFSFLHSTFGLICYSTHIKAEWNWRKREDSFAGFCFDTAAGVCTYVWVCTLITERKRVRVCACACLFTFDRVIQ